MIETLKTDFKDEILAEGQDKRTYNIYDQNDDLLYSDASLEKSYEVAQQGDQFNAKVLNDLCTTINENFSQTPLIYYGSSEPSEEIISQMRDGDLFVLYEV